MLFLSATHECQLFAMENKTNSPPILGIPKPQHDMLSLSITVSTRMAPSAFLPAVFLSRATTILRNSLKRLFSFVIFRDYIISLFFRYCGLSPTAVRLDGQTSLALWRPARHRKGRPTLVLVHGFGGNAKWQWVHQIRALTDSFNVYVPDLIFFGDSVSDSDERSVEFQARCVAEGLKRVGLRRYSVSGISYGGFVAYWMAVALGEEVVEKVVILTAGICATEEEREEMKRRKVDGRDIVELLMPERAEDLRTLMEFSMHRVPWVPLFVLQDFIRVHFCNFPLGR
ncbi:hypothetical protein ACLOJK_025397 [Asimina triloba]